MWTNIHNYFLLKYKHLHKTKEILAKINIVNHSNWVILANNNKFNIAQVVKKKKQILLYRERDGQMWLIFMTLLQLTKKLLFTYLLCFWQMRHAQWEFAHKSKIDCSVHVHLLANRNLDCKHTSIIDKILLY